MSKNKYYAVRVGKVPGIYESWEQCKKMIDGYSGAEYKAFANKEDAIAFLENQDVGEKYKEVANQTNSVIAYVDGSYSDSAKKYSYGCILILPSGEILRMSGSGDDPRAIAVRNVAGELQGAMYAVRKTAELGYKRIIIRHDYIGISKWFTGEWKAKDEIAKIYIDYLTKYQNHIEIIFEKVVAHSGDKFNEEADQLARGALEKSDKTTIENSKISEGAKSAQDVLSREKVIKVILDCTLESSEVIEYLGISIQKLTSMNKTEKLVPIKKGIYLRSDVENIKEELKK